MIQYGAGYSSAFVVASALAALGLVALALTVRERSVARLRSAPV
jgi:hypothetical protein